MAKKVSSRKDGTSSLDIDQLYRDDVDRVRKGERALVFGALNDMPLENVSPEMGLAGGVPRAGATGVSSLLGVMNVGGRTIITPVDMAKILGHLGGKVVYKGAKMVGDEVRKVVPKVIRPLYDEAGKAIMQSSDKGLSIIGEEIIREQELADMDAANNPVGNYAKGGNTPKRGEGKYVIRPGRENQDYQMATYDFMFDYLTEEKDIPRTQAIGILANIASESGGDTEALGKAGDFGIQQWLGPRKKELKRRYGDSPTLEQQLEYLVDEYRGDVPGMGWNYFNKGKFFDEDKAGNKYGYYQYSKSEFDNAPNYRDATVSWNQGFGRPLGSTLRNEHRISVADKFAERYGEDVVSDQKYPFGSSYDEPVLDGGANAGDGKIDESMRDMANDPQPAITSLQTWWDENGKDILERTMTMSSSNTKAIKDLTASMDKDGDVRKETEEDRRISKEEAMRNMVLGILPGIRLDIKGMSKGKA